MSLVTTLSLYNNKQVNKAKQTMVKQTLFIKQLILIIFE